MLLKIKIWLYIHFLKAFYGFSAIDTALIYAQARHETGDFTSRIFKENKNLFGMRAAKVRKNFANGSNYGHAVFSSYFDSVRDYYERQKYFGVSARSNEYFIDSTIKSNYAEDTKYAEKWFVMWEHNKIPKYIRYSHHALFLVLVLGILYGLYTFRGSNPSQRKFDKAVKSFVMHPVKN